MVVDAVKLTRALKAKYRTPAGVLARLGLDADLLAPTLENEAAALRIDIENLLAGFDLDERQIDQIFKLLDKHARSDQSKPARDREAAGKDEWPDRVRAFLVEKGLREGDIAEAMRIASGGNARDNFPEPATQLGFGGRLGMDGASPLERIRGENCDWARAIRRDDLGTLGAALERGARQRALGRTNRTR